MKIIRLKTIDSTHLYAIRLVESNSSALKDAENIAIVAEEQTNGIGRCKRQWVSLKGNLFTSVIMRMPISNDLGQLSLATACAVHEAICNYLSDESYVSDLSLHWPNDVYYKQKKISGVLLAVSNNFLIISVGINVEKCPDDENIGRQSTCLRKIVLSNVELHLNELLCILLERIEMWITQLCKAGFPDIKSYWLRNINDINCNVTIKNGLFIVNGFFLGIDDSGKAILENENGRVLISSGDFFESK
ncbi:MAG: biotin--[Alphaproteobacteria bacterium]|nr:biotin--[acetyl-CoA-carboxylase] ligase [Alphaproteobacteria bacterium]